jgi:phosphoribosylaminoimidazolecarboxamide formyltransferase/IMP cyclohydrolase
MSFRLAVLVSGSGTLLQSLIDARAAGRLTAEIVAVGADRECAGIERARAAGLPVFVHPLVRGADRAAWDADLARLLAVHDPDLVVSAGFMKLVGPAVLARFGGRLINTHPALLPSFPGAHGVRDALAHGVKVTGCTVFEIDAGVDTGRIIAQEPVRVLPDDSEATLHERIKVVERQLLVDTVNALADHERLSMNDATSPDAAGRLPLRRALVSVYDKTGLVDLGRALADAGVRLVSTGGSYRTLTEAGVPVTEVAELTGFPECLDGRVKTLHPRVHAGILADRRLAAHRDQLAELGVEPFDLVVSNLYPFADTVASGASADACVEQIDIGGPSMVRAAAKNHPSVAIVTSPAQYPELLAAVAAGGFTLAERRALAAAAFVHTATYDVAVASWMGSVLTDTSGGDGFPAWVGATWDKAGTLRYGENSHQPAALYTVGHGRPGIAQAEQLHGKEMSYNNYTDGDAAYRAASDFAEPCVAIIKHANPCGLAVGADIAEAHRRAHACDPVSAYGGVIAANRPVSVALAEQVAGVFTEVILAPGYDEGAVEILNRKKNIRILVVPPYPRGGVETRAVTGGLLMQHADALDAPGDDPAHWELKAGDPVDAATLADLAFAWRACRAVKSNAILLASGGASVGVGMGQVNRVDSCRLAVERAGDRARGAVAASDAFFPFSDGPQILIDGGVTAIVEPGGSIRDADTIELCRERGVALYFTGTRHFFH